MYLCRPPGFDFGVRQNSERVNHVNLPHWARNDPRLFILIHRQALESDQVSQTLCQWIDLVFGLKQKGKAAVHAINVFHPAVSNLYTPCQLYRLVYIVDLVFGLEQKGKAAVCAINVFHPAVSLLPGAYIFHQTEANRLEQRGTGFGQKN